LNGDGKLDVAAAQAGGSNVSVLQGNGAGNLGAAGQVPVGYNPVSVAVGDLDGDGRLDVVTANHDSNDLSVLKNGGNDGSGNATFGYGGGSGPDAVVVGNFNGDTFPDVAVANYYSGDASVLLNDTDWRSLVVSGLASSTTAGQAQTFTVTVLDNVGNVMTGYTGTMHFSSGDYQAGLPADYQFTAADAGVHTFTV